MITTHRLVRCALSVALALTCQRGLAQAQVCSEGRIFGIEPGKVSKFVSCLPSQRTDPVLVQVLAKLNERAASDQDFGRSVEKLIAALGPVSAELSSRKLATLSATLTKRLDEQNAKSNTVLLREIDRLRISFEELSEKVTASRKGPAASKTEAALGGDAGDAVASLDLDRANRILDELAGIRSAVEGVGADVKGMRNEVADANAVARLAELSRTKPKGQLGQTDAVKLLLGGGRTFNAVDYAGLTFADAELDTINLNDAKLAMTDFSRARLGKASFEGAELTAANMSDAVLVDARLSRSSATLAQAARVQLRGADLRRSSWTAANLDHADLRNARLQGAYLAMVDLGGADLSGADLTNTFLGGAELRGAKFDGAVFGNTDVIGSTVDTSKMTPAQRAGLCASKPERRGGGYFWTIFEDTPSNRYDSGFTYTDLMQYGTNAVFWPLLAARAFPACARLGDEDRPPKRNNYGDGDWDSGIRLHLPSQLLGTGGRRDELRKLALDTVVRVQARAFASADIAELVPVRRERRRAMDERLNAVAAQKPKQTPVIDEYSDTQMLLIAKLDARLFEPLKVVWTEVSWSNAAWPEWPFPNDDGMMYTVDRNADAVAVYRDWLKRRAAVWSDTSVQFPGTLERIASGDQKIADLQPIAAEFKVPLERVAYGPLFHPNGKDELQGVLILRGGYDEARELTKRDPTTGRGNLFIVHMRGVALSKTPGRRGLPYLVWTADVALP